MNISNFTVSSDKNKQFLYGVKLIPSLAMDRFVDAILISAVENNRGYNEYEISFKRRCGIKTIVNNFKFNRKNFMAYIKFLTSFKSLDIKYRKFVVEEFGEIELVSLNRRMIKISSKNNCNKLFFVISRKELASYINILKSVYLTQINNSFIYYDNYIVDPLSKRERDEFYREILLTLIDGALDARNKGLFSYLCNELKILK
ncbi:IDEAL domain-containing protein [Clostridium sp. WLY-B-L2]|uniref:IDEAL domain-containing protein n=1 Tax=Clostridium aromativorans TaxID=2836848 RepID=A0ABS8N4X4_9CLOT|nr:IDEAL domain-containing protein [Clostridium aromativorans]MCC9294865.1 IDEAL domain-containing protein [Clostridium aromativorans]CAB1250439.1 IDEAL domain-containing protein [Clostridiaceae bacterium BL-3]